MNNYSNGIYAESAYGSDITSNSSFPIKKETFSMEEPTKKKAIWYKWLKQQVRDYMIIEAVFFIILILQLSSSYHISTNIERALDSINKLQSDFEEFKKQSSVFSEIDEEGKLEKETQKMEEFMSEVLKEIEPIKNLKESVQTSKTKQIGKDVSTSSLQQFNAANTLFGATIDTSRSSSSDLSPFIGRDQSGLVLLDRPEPPVNRAWCSYDKEPVLTVNLAKYIKPISVSYQHSKWNGTIPQGAPKIYDVVACLDYYCEKWTPLATNCYYISTTHQKQEQKCTIHHSSNLTSIGKVQFRFRKNHGITEKTCVNLVRVYGESNEIPKTKEITLKDDAVCADLNKGYHHSNFLYNTFYFKNCTLLYSKNCCSECPECCEECLMHDINGEVIALGFALPILAVMVALLFIMILGFLLVCCVGIYECCSKT